MQKTSFLTPSANQVIPLIVTDTFELSPWVWQAQLSPTASVDDIIELCLVFFDEIMLPWQVLKIAKSKLQPDDPLLMGLGQG